MSSRDTIVIMIPTIFSWVLASLLLLVYPFDILEYVETLPTNPLAGLGLFLLGGILILAVAALFLTGDILDKHPEYLRRITTIGLIGCSISVMLLVLLVEYGLFILISLVGLAIFFGITITSAGTLFAGLIPLQKRGSIYSLGIFAFILISLASILLGGLISSRFASGLLTMSWVSILPLLGLLGIGLSVIFWLFSQGLDKPWINDRWPTHFRKIFGRRSVKAYLLTHVFIYLMLGISIASFARIGEISFDTSWVITIPSLDVFELPKDKVFWFVVLLGDLTLVLFAGRLSDRIGRKSLVVIALYGIVFASLIFGLERTPGSFLAAAFITGVSFALLHPTLDSSIWADLSPRDGLGRYFALGFISLAVGLGMGTAIGHWMLQPTLDNIGFITYILTILAIMGAFPLFWVADSFKPLEFTLLIVIEEGGLNIFDYSFGREIDVELTLLSGALTAVSSFFSETLKEKGILNLVRHGNHFILTDRDAETRLSAAVFSNKQDPELHSSLGKFLDRFCKDYGAIIKSWNGARSKFEGAAELAEEFFGHLSPSRDLPSKNTPHDMVSQL
ncbi:MAG: MFS transporter [Candidatus Heimdallarchaeota archaeon]